MATEVRMVTRQVGYMDEVAYTTPKQARQWAFEIGRFWKAEGHKVTVVRMSGYCLLTVWDAGSHLAPGAVGGMLVSVDIREWEG